MRAMHESTQASIRGQCQDGNADSEVPGFLARTQTSRDGSAGAQTGQYECTDSQHVTVPHLNHLLRRVALPSHGTAIQKPASRQIPNIRPGPVYRGQVTRI